MTRCGLSTSMAKSAEGICPLPSWGDSAFDTLLLFLLGLGNLTSKSVPAGSSERRIMRMMRAISGWRSTNWCCTVMRSASVFVLFSIGMLFSDSRRLPPDTTSVTILAVTPFGEVLAPVKVTQFSKGDVNGRDYSADFAGPKALEIPYGKYFARVNVGKRGVATDVQVGRPDALIVVSVPDRFVEKGPGVRGVTGEVSGTGGLKPVWLRLVRVYAEDLCCTIVPLSDDGRFSFGNVESGDYLLLVLSNARVLFEDRIRIEDVPNTVINVDIGRGRATLRSQ
jgi:hypothetical protein